MTYRLFFVIVALTLIAPLAQAHGVSTADTVKVNNRPSRVVISVDSGQVRGFSLDYVAMVSYNGVGAFFRYSPQSVFKTSQGPEIKNRWTLGIVLRGRLFR